MIKETKENTKNIEVKKEKENSSWKYDTPPPKPSREELRFRHTNLDDSPTTRYMMNNYLCLYIRFIYVLYVYNFILCMYYYLLFFHFVFKRLRAFRWAGVVGAGCVAGSRGLDVI